MPDHTIQLKPVDAITIVGARERVRDSRRIRERCIALNQMAYAPLAAGMLRSDGVSLALYHASDEDGLDVEMAYAVQPPRQELYLMRGTQLSDLPAATVAYAVYQGSYDDFAAVKQVHQALGAWIAANGYRVAGATREYYLRPPRSAAHREGVMEIQIPVVATG